MPLIDHFLSVRSFRKTIWGFWYPFLTRRTRQDPVLFLNYAYEDGASPPIPLDREDEPHRACIQLYRHVAEGENLEGRDVLEVGCGHGGGAAYMASAFRPRSLVGLDLNPEAIRFSSEKHRAPGLSFRRGDAENIPFPDGSFDHVVNVESSHCYPDFPRFLSEAARVLRPGGRFHYADFRFSEGTPAWEAALASCPLKTTGWKDITPHVLRGMDLNSPRSLNLVRRLLPRFLQDLGRDFAGVTGSRIHTAFHTGKASYRSYQLRKESFS